MVRKIAVVGNTGGGKSTLSRRLSKVHQLPLTHVDSIQFLPSLEIRPYAETIQVLSEIQDRADWIIDGYGPLDIIEKRFELADRIVFIDFPIWRHYFWFLKRQVRNIFSPREELPAGASEVSLSHTKRVLKTMKSMHLKMRPELLRIFSRDALKHKMIHVRTLSDWNKVFQSGVKSR